MSYGTDNDKQQLYKAIQQRLSSINFFQNTPALYAAQKPTYPALMKIPG